MKVIGRISHKVAAIAVPLATAAALVIPSAASAAEFPLRAWWPLAEGSGQTVRDWSGKGNNGYLGSTTGADSNDPKWIRGGIFGFGNALRFDGVDDFVTVPDSASLKPEQLTVSLWFRGSSSPGQYKYLFARGGQDCTAASYGLQTHFSGGLGFTVWDGSSVRNSGIADASVWDGKWHHAAGTWDGTTAKLFIDGKEVPGSSPNAGQIDYNGPTGETILGGYHAGCDLLMQGDLDQVMLWSQALPVDQIWNSLAALFNKPRR
jgi:hypothetical protein